MGYRQNYEKVEDYASVLQHRKAKEAWYKVEVEQAEIGAERDFQLADGTTERKPVKGLRLTGKITLTSVGFSNPLEAEQKAVGAILNQAKPDTHLVFVSLIAQKDCFTNEEIALFDQDLNAGKTGVIGEVKKIWTGVFFEGVVNLIE